MTPLGANHFGILKGCAEQMPVFQMAATAAKNFVETMLGLSNSYAIESDVFNMELLGVSCLCHLHWRKCSLVFGVV